jgi:hypothetical protein
MLTARPEEIPHLGLYSQPLYFQTDARFRSFFSSRERGAPHAVLTNFVNLASLARLEKHLPPAAKAAP